MLNKDVEDGMNYDRIIQKYHDQLGFEAKLLLRALLPNDTQDVF